MDALNELRQYLHSVAPGNIAFDTSLLFYLSCSWNDLAGSGDEGMTTDKLRRMERIEWRPPRLSFVIERHGQTVMGSTRGSLHLWEIDVDRATATCKPDFSYRQLYPRAPAFHVEPLVTEIVDLILSGDKGDPRLKWLPDRSVRVLVGDFVSANYKQTQEGRRKRFRVALDKELAARGWIKVPRTRDVYRLL